MRSFIFLFLKWFVIKANIHNRLPRQSVLSNHVQVNALESSIVLGGRTFIQSGENRIDFNELHLNGSFWSDSSSLNFDRSETYSNVSGTNTELFVTAEDEVKADSKGDIGEVFIQTNRSSDGQTVLNHFVQGSANLSFDDGVMKVQGINGKRIEMDLLTWNCDVKKKITLEAETITGGMRRLIIDAIGKPYHATIRFEGALVYFAYAGKYVRLDPTYKLIEIFTDKYAVTVKTKNAPFELSFENKEVLIGLPAEQTKVRVHSEGVNVNAKQLTKTHIDQDKGKIILGKEPITSNGVMIAAKKTNLDMNNKGDVNTNTNNSFILIESAVQPVALTAAHHNLKVNDGIPHIIVDPGISQVEIVANRGSFAIGNMLRPFKPREDKFVDVGPFPGGKTPPPDFFPQTSTVETLSSSRMPIENFENTEIVKSTTTELFTSTITTDSSLPKQAEVPEIPMPPTGDEMPVPPTFPISTERIPEVAADLPQSRPSTAKPIDKSKTVVDETNTTNTETSFEDPKKKPIAIDPAMAKIMAADVRQPSIPTTTTGVTTIMTSTTISSTTSGTKKPVTIDVLLAKSMAADLPQRIVTRPNESNSEETTTALSDKISTGQLTTGEELAATDDIGMKDPFTSATTPSPTILESATTNDKSSTSEVESLEHDELGNGSVGSTENAMLEESTLLATTITPGRDHVDSETVSEDETNITDTRISVKSPSVKGTSTTDFLSPTGEITETSTIVQEVTSPIITSKSITESAFTVTEQATTMTSTSFSTLPVGESTITTTVPPPTSVTELITTLPDTETPTTTTMATTLNPLEELKQLREAMEKMKKFKEWEELEVSHGGDGDEHVEEFTFPNGTTVHRVVKTSRRITTTITHHRKEEINDTTEGKPQRSDGVVLSTVARTSDDLRLKRQINPILRFGRRYLWKKDNVILTQPPNHSLFLLFPEFEI